MRFLLVEKDGAPPSPVKQGGKTDIKSKYPPNRQVLDRYSKLKTNDEQVAFIEEHIINDPTFKHLFGLRPIIIDSILIYGLNPKKNFFLDFISKMKRPFKNRKDRPKMQYIYDSFKNKKLDIRMPVLYNPSLYDRSEREFRYTLNAFNLMSDDDKVRAYLKNSKKISKVVDVDQFFLDGNDMVNSTIKPGGSDGRSGDTIFNVIEGWVKTCGEYSPEEIANNKNRLAKEKEKGDGTESNGLPSGWNYDGFKAKIEYVFANKSKFKTSLSHEDDYLNRLFATFSLSRLRPTDTDKVVQVASITDIDDQMADDFGRVDEVDEPIYLTASVEGEEIKGAYVFHRFIPLDDESVKKYKKLSSNNARVLSLKVHNIAPTDDASMNAYIQSIIEGVELLQPLPNE